MQIELIVNQMAELKEFFAQAKKDCQNKAKGAVVAQIWDCGIMEVNYVKNECAIKMIEVLREYYPAKKAGRTL